MAVALVPAPYLARNSAGQQIWLTNSLWCRCLEGRRGLRHLVRARLLAAAPLARVRLAVLRPLILAGFLLVPCLGLGRRPLLFLTLWCRLPLLPRVLCLMLRRRLPLPLALVRCLSLILAPRRRLSRLPRLPPAWLCSHRW